MKIATLETRAPDIENYTHFKAEKRATMIL